MISSFQVKAFLIIGMQHIWVIYEISDIKWALNKVSLRKSQEVVVYTYIVIYTYILNIVLFMLFITFTDS